ncbi:hypothetical protein F5148DRAFT_1372583 [Russula earlei]|uniref:Uncharacterized protein n=1 Tax=Russula earlei TaxID=71964 RepID=A0ACC0UNQ6_9AGAM|nr:hypothetical protein F5148DRAFT_1372583 [Russula earlei]
MPPILRSSTPTHGRTGIETTPTKSPRKIPHCTKCQRPRAGHPRQGCPYIQSLNSSEQPTDLDVTITMGSLAISPTKTARGERRRRHGPPTHEITLESLSTESSELLNRLLESENTRDPLSFLDKHVGPGPASNLHWNPNSSSKSLFKDGRVMPGTLVTPGASFVTEVPPAQETPEPNGYSDSKARSEGAAPLARSMSMEERTAFLDGLAELSRGPPATVYAIHAHELHRIAESATRLGFYTGTVLPEVGSGELGLLILGRDFVRVREAFIAKPPIHMQYEEEVSPHDGAREAYPPRSDLRSLGGSRDLEVVLLLCKWPQPAVATTYRVNTFTNFRMPQPQRNGFLALWRRQRVVPPFRRLRKQGKSKLARDVYRPLNPGFKKALTAGQK